MNRKQRRAREAQIRKDSNDELSAKVAMFGKLPEQCTACEAVFDSKDKEMHDKDNPVRLYCPTCWNTAQEVINNFMKTLEENDET